MNYLAHILLSGDDRRLQIGNFIGDAVKGSAYKNYPQAVADGILLHRAIDSHTDKHHLVRQSVRELRPYFGRYSGIILDMYFDYLLASRFREFYRMPLKRFTGRFYRNMVVNRRYLPERIRGFMWHFILTDRLGSYSTPKGLRRSLDIMVEVHGIDISVDKAMEYLAANEETLMTVFRPFFAEMTDLCKGYIAAADRTEYLQRF